MTVGLKKDREIAHLFFLIAAAAGYLLLQIPLSSYIVDDAFIHLTFARNLSQGQGFSFNPGQPVYGITAPLWTLLLAAWGLVIPLSPTVAKTLSIICGLLTLPVFYRLGIQIGLSRVNSAYAALVWGVNIWLVRWAASGMEAALAVLLLLLAVGAGLKASPLAGLWWGLSLLVRPEFVLLFLLMLFFTGFTQNLRKAFITGTIGVLINLPWLIYARCVFGSWTPNPWLIKSDAGLPSLGDLGFNLIRTIKILLVSNGIEIILILVILVLIFYRFRTLPLKSSKTIIFLIWVAVLPLFYLARGVFVQSRYLLPMLPALTLTAFIGVRKLLSYPTLKSNFTNRLFSRRYGFLVLTMVLAAQQLLLTQQITIPHIAAFQETIQALRRLSDYLRLETPPESVVAAGDVGILGFYSERCIVDFEGLVTSEIVPYRKGKSLDKYIQTEEFLKVGQPDYFIDKTPEPGRMIKVNPDRYHPLRVEPIPGAMVDNADEKWFYTLYQVDL